MNSALLDIYDFFSEAELKYQFVGHGDKTQFLYDYCKEHRHQKLSPTALHFFNLDVSTKNLRSFAKTASKFRSRINDFMIVRYIVSTMEQSEFLDGLLNKYRKYQFLVVDETHGKEALRVTKGNLGAIWVQTEADDSPCGIKLTIRYSFPSSEQFHIFREITESFGLTAELDRYLKGSISQATFRMVVTREQKEAIKIGRKLAIARFPDQEFE